MKLYRTVAAVLTIGWLSPLAVSAGSLKDDIVYTESVPWGGPFVGIFGGFTTGGDAGLDGKKHAMMAWDEGVGESKLGGGGGGLVGIQIGYDRILSWHSDRGMFIGVTADVAALSHEMTRDDKLTANIAGHSLYAQQSDTRSSVELWSLMTARLRAGIETERMKYYITGGLAAGLIETETQSWTLGWNVLAPGDTQIIASGRSSKSELGLGFAVGGGIEMRLSEEWSLGAEYLYYQIPVSLSNKIEFTNGYNGDPAIYKMDADVGDHLFKIQVNYRPSTWSIFPNTPR